MFFRFLSALALALAALPLQASVQTLYPGQSALVGTTTVECRENSGYDRPVHPSCFNNGLGAARVLCNGFPNWEQVDECLAALKNATYFDLDAVPFCRGYPNWAGVLECLKIGANRQVEAAELRVCTGRPSWASTTSCWGNIGTMISCF